MNLSSFIIGQDLLSLSSCLCPQLPRSVSPWANFIHPTPSCIVFIVCSSWEVRADDKPGFMVPLSLHPCQLAVTPMYTVGNWNVIVAFVYCLCGRKHSWHENEAKIWCAMRTYGSSCLFKILMASPLLPWGRWPFLGQLPTALLLSSLCWNASKPTVFTLFSSSAECNQHRLIMCLSAATITFDSY